MRLTHETSSASRHKPRRVHDPLRCLLGIHHWEWWLDGEVCVRCVRCYRRGEAGAAPAPVMKARAGSVA
jgi:hypothetical protein